MSVTYRIRRKTGGDLVADFATGLYNLTRGDSVSITFRIDKEDVDPLTVSGTYTVPSGTSESYPSVTVRNGATLTIESGATLTTGTLDNNGTVNNDGTLTIRPLVFGTSAWVELQQTADFGGQYTINETLDASQTYAERLPVGADVDSLVLGIEPSTDLQSENVSGIWGIVDGGTDERPPTLNEYRYTVDLTVLADFDEYNSVTDVETDLKTN